MILKKCVTLQFCAKLLCTELVETYKKIKNGTTSYISLDTALSSDGYIG